jgi:hypothetical protein
MAGMLAAAPRWLHIKPLLESKRLQVQNQNQNPQHAAKVVVVAV